MHPRVAYVTHAGSAAHDPDLDVALPAIEAAGLDPEVHPWDSTVEWDRFDLVLVRSAWEHTRRRPDFLRWARWVEDHTRLANPAVTLARNTDRTYLRDLRKDGLPVVETIWLEPGEDPALCQAQIDERGWDRCVVRPHIGTGSDGLVVVDGVTSAARVAGSLAEGGAVAMVQPAPWVEDPSGTMSVVVLDGHISHGVVTDHVHGRSGPELATDLDDAITDVVSAVFDAASAGEQLLYARVDLVNDGGEWLLWGFEATDPCLFLDAAPGSGAVLGRAVRAWIMPEAQAADFLVGSG
jgi:O-ureido-D-serine cyclo-ligase